MSDRPDIDQDDLFRAFVAGQQYGAMIYLGKFVHPGSGKLERNLDAAKYAIDLLGMIERKTRGNLDRDEERFLGEVLTTLRLNFVDEVEKDRQAAGKETESLRSAEAEATPNGETEAKPREGGEAAGGAE